MDTKKQNTEKLEQNSHKAEQNTRLTALILLLSLLSLGLLPFKNKLIKPIKNPQKHAPNEVMNPWLAGCLIVLLIVLLIMIVGASLCIGMWR